MSILETFDKVANKMAIEVLTIMLSEDLARFYFKVNSTLYQQWIIVKHFLIISSHELILYMIAAIVQARSADVATCTFQTVGFGFHFRIVTLFDGLSECLE